MKFTINAAACSDKGCRRHNNEDNFCLNGLYMKREEMDRGGLFETIVSQPALFAVCDGMGGEEAGEEASLLSVMLCTEYLEKENISLETKALRRFMRQGCIAVLHQAEDNENNSGSTIAALLLSNDGLLPANMGDSRIYRFSQNKLTQISQDHTEIQWLLQLHRLLQKRMQSYILLETLTWSSGQSSMG